MDMKMLNPYNQQFDAVKARIIVNVSLEFELLQDFTLVGNVKDISTEVTEF